MYYGLQFKNLSLYRDLKDKDKGTIIPKEHVKKFNMLHKFLQAIRGNVEFENKVFSIFTFKIHRNAYGDIEEDYFFSDDIFRASISIQIGEIGIICCFGENGLIEEVMEKELKPFKEYYLHQSQFSQITAMVYYRRALLLKTPSYILMENKEDGHTIIYSNYSNPIFGEFKQIEYAMFLAYQIQRYNMPFEHIYREEIDAVANFLMRPNGDLEILDKFGKPMPVKIRNPFFNGELFENPYKTNY